MTRQPRAVPAASDTDAVAQRLRILGEPLRLRLIAALRGGEETVTRLAQGLGTSQPNVSKHLKVLLEHGLVTRRQQRNSAFYALSGTAAISIVEATRATLSA